MDFFRSITLCCIFLQNPTTMNVEQKKKISVAPFHYACSCNKFIYFSITFATKRNNTSHGITKKYHTEVVQKESITHIFKYAAFLRYLNRIVSTSFCKWTLPKDHPQCYIPCDHKRAPEFPNLCSILHDEKLEKRSLKESDSRKTGVVAS